MKKNETIGGLRF